jgi:SP family arabinose:H+ symporter-like MFS transporter
MSIATAALWGACILVTNTFLSVVKMFGVSGAFLIYGSSCMVAVCFVFFLPETMGRSLEDIHRGNTTDARADRPIT